MTCGGQGLHLLRDDRVGRSRLHLLCLSLSLPSRLSWSIALFRLNDAWFWQGVVDKKAAPLALGAQASRWAVGRGAKQRWSKHPLANTLPPLAARPMGSSEDPRMRSSQK
jgi:hypothetical protein